MNHKEATEIKLEKARELIDTINVSQKVQMFQQTFFNYERLKKRLNYYQKIIEERKMNDI